MGSLFRQLHPPKVVTKVRRIDFEESKLELVGQSHTDVM